jgi:hypothetical protein
VKTPTLGTLFWPSAWRPAESSRVASKWAVFGVLERRQGRIPELGHFQVSGKCRPDLSILPVASPHIRSSLMCRGVVQEHGGLDQFPYARVDGPRPAQPAVEPAGDGRASFLRFQPNVEWGIVPYVWPAHPQRVN